MNYKLTKICIDKISDYVGFDIVEIFKQGDHIAIFGGAVRDSLAEQEINDVDIMCMPKSANMLASYLVTKKGYKQIDHYKEISLEQYNEMHVISEPWTFIKDDKFIQIIRPSNYYDLDNYYSLLSDVDITSCGVFLNLIRNEDIRLMESSKGAITHCRSRVFMTLKNNRMFGEHRTGKRSQKLMSRGWTEVTDKLPIKQDRLMKLYGLQKPEYDFSSYKEPPKVSRIENTTKLDDVFWL